MRLKNHFMPGVRHALLLVPFVLVPFLAAAQSGPSPRDPSRDENPVAVFAGERGASTPARPFEIDDLLARRSIESVVPNRHAPMVAVRLERPRRVGESYVAAARGLGDNAQRRADLLVISLALKNVVLDTREHPEIRSSFSPIWSADGARLAFVGVDGSGASVLYIWSWRDGALVSMPVPPIRRDVPVRGADGTAGREYALAWTGRSKLMAISAEGGHVETLGPARLDALSNAWRATWAGQRSVSVRTSGPVAACKPDDALIEIDVDSRRIRKVAAGPIKAASVAPDSSRVVVVTALPRETLEYSGLKSFPPQANLGDYELDVPWKVEILPLSGTRAAFTWIDRAEGPVSVDSMPRWSADGRRLYAVTRDDFLVRAAEANLLTLDMKSARSDKYAFDGLRSAELAGDYFLAGYPVPKDLSVPRVQTRSYGREPRVPSVQAAYRDFSYLVDGQFVRMRGGARESRATPPKSLLWQNARGTADVLVLEEPAIDATFDGMAGDRFALFHADTPGGTYVWATEPGKAAVQVLGTNAYFGQVRSPAHVPVSYQVGGEERNGLLYFPTRQKTPAPPPVVVNAYPSDRALRERLSNTNAASGWQIHSLLTHGFAVFVADYRAMPTGDRSPLTSRIMKEMLPALDALKQRKDIKGDTPGFIGHSYGGVTALTLLGRTSALKAIVASAPLADFAQYGRVTYTEFTELGCAPAVLRDGARELQSSDGFLAFDGPITDHVETYQRESPLNHLSKATVPTLLLTGEFDTFALGADQVHAALVEKGVPAELVIYRAEAHNLTSPGNLADASDRIVRWFERYLDGDR